MRTYLWYAWYTRLAFAAYFFGNFLGERWVLLMDFYYAGLHCDTDITNLFLQNWNFQFQSASICAYDTSSVLSNRPLQKLFFPTQRLLFCERTLDTAEQVGGTWTRSYERNASNCTAYESLTTAPSWSPHWNPSIWIHRAAPFRSSVPHCSSDSACFGIPTWCRCPEACFGSPLQGRPMNFPLRFQKWPIKGCWELSGNTAVVFKFPPGI